MRRLLPILVLLLWPASAQAGRAYGPALFMLDEGEVPLACTYRSKAWSVREAHGIFPAGTTPRFVRLHLGGALTARVDLPVDGIVPPRVMLERDGVVLNGGLESRDLLYPLGPLKVSEVLYTHQKSRLRWFGGKKGRVRVGLPEAHKVYRAVNTTKKTMVLCAEVGLEPGEAERFRRAHGVKHHAEAKWVRLKEELPVAAEPGGGPRLFLPPAHKDPYFDADSGREMYFIKLRKGRMKILTSTWNHHIVGWVNARALRHRGEAMAALLGDTPGEEEPPPAGGGRCPVDLRLHAHAKGKTMRVGVVRAGTRMLAHPGASTGWLKVSFPDVSWFVVEPEAMLMIRAKHRKRCPGL